MKSFADNMDARLGRAMLSNLVLDSNSFKTEGDRQAFIAHGGTGICMCPECRGKIAVYIKSQGVRAGEKAIKKFTCSCNYPDDAFGFYSALTGKDNARSFVEVMEMATGQKLSVEQVEKEQTVNKSHMSDFKKKIIEEVRDLTNFGAEMPKVAINALKQRGLDIDALKQKGVFNKIGFIREGEITSISGNQYTVTGIVFDKGDGIKIRRTDEDGVYISDKKRRFLGYGSSPAFGVCDNKTPICFITEGEFDALSIISHGKNAIALSGANNKESFYSFLENNDKEKKNIYIISLDGDETGKNASYSLLQDAKNKGVKIFEFNMNGDYHDINDFQKANPTNLSLRLDTAEHIAKLALQNKITIEQCSELGHEFNIISHLEDKTLRIREWKGYENKINNMESMSYGLKNRNKEQSLSL